MSEIVINILLVEDDEIDVINVKKAFMRVNITNSVYLKSYGVEALSTLHGNSPQPPDVSLEQRLVLLDLNIPKMGRIEFLQELCSNPILTKTPVVVMTRSNQEQHRVKASSLNVTG